MIQKMFIRVATGVLAIFWSASCSNTEPTSCSFTSAGAYDSIEWVGGRDHNGFARLEDTIAEADAEFYLDGEDMLKRQNSHEPPFLLPRSGGSKIDFSNSYTGFIVVQLHKLAQIEDVDLKVSRINDFFFSRGVDRVLVTGFRAMGRSVYSDKIRETNKPPHDTP